MMSTHDRTTADTREPRRQGAVRWRLAGAALTAALVLSACGEGGGDSDDGQQTEPPAAQPQWSDWVELPSAVTPLHTAQDKVLVQRHDNQRLQVLDSAGQEKWTVPEVAMVETYQALASADGEYLPQLQGEWVEQARAQHRAAVVHGYLMLSELHCAARDCPLSAQALVKAAQHDPLIGEDHHQKLMACLSMTRDRFAAIEHYRRYRHFLASEVGDTPMHDTELLAERIKSGERLCEHLPFTPQKS